MRGGPFRGFLKRRSVAGAVAATKRYRFGAAMVSRGGDRREAKSGGATVTQARCAAADGGPGAGGDRCASASPPAPGINAEEATTGQLTERSRKAAIVVVSGKVDI